jgi:hypothetical protein
MKFPSSFISSLCLITIVSNAGFWPVSPQKSSWRGTIEYRNGVTVVSNPAEPQYPETVFRLEEELVIGGGEGGAKGELIFPWYVAVDSDGSIYVMDRGDDCVKVFSKEGGFIRSIGRRGQGPGELQNPNSIHLLANHDLVFEDFIRGLNYFDKDGSFKRFVPISWLINIWMFPDGRSVTRVNARKDDVAGKEIRYCDADLKTISTLLFLPDQPRDLSVFRPFAPSFSWTVMTGDRLAMAYQTDYKIDIHGLRDSAKEVIQRAGDRVKITSEELAAVKKLLRGRTLDAPAVHPAIQDLQADDEGRLIVKTFEKTKDGLSFYYDVFDREGVFLAKIPLPAHLRPLVWKNRSMYGLEEDAEGNPSLKRFRVNWSFAR